MKREPYPNKKHVRLSEDQVIDILINDDKESGRVNFSHFFNVVWTGRDYEDIFNYKGVYIAKNVQRSSMGFLPNAKPGDFDVIIIPYGLHRIYFEATAVYEIKVVRPTRQRPRKSPNSLGLTQLRGLIHDGFPLVSLMHICMSEPLKDCEKMPLKFCTIPANGTPPIGYSGNFNDYLIDVKMDHFSWWSADNQMKRLISEDIPKYAGISAFGLDVHNENDYTLTSCSVAYSRFQSGYLNPHRKEETVLQVIDHFKNNQDVYKKVTIRD